MKFHYELTPEAVENLYIETGNRQRNGMLEIKDTDCTPEQRAKYIALQAALKELDRSAIYAPLGTLTVATSPLVRVSIAPLDAPPNAESVWSIVDQMLSQKDQIATQYEEAKAARAEEQEARKIAMQEAREKRLEAQAAAEKARAELAREKREAAAVINWTGDKSVLDLLDRLFAVSGDEQDSRFSSWAKVVTGVTQTHDNGYDFEGDFINEGTVEISREKAVYLVASASGSRKYHVTTYRVVVLNPETGNLERTDITTTNETPGWALRIRDQVKTLLA